MQTRFTFTGNLSFNDISSNNPFLREGKTKNGAKYCSVSFAVVPSKNNRAYVEVYGMERSEISTIDANKNKVTVSWSDRFDEKVVKSVASYRKYTLRIGEKRLEFISDYDFAKSIAEHASELKDPTRTFVVSGNVSKNVYNGTIRDRFNVDSIYETDSEGKNRMRITEEFFYNKESFDTEDWNEKNVLTINGYTKEYIDKEHPAVYVPQMIIMDCSKLDLENEEHNKIVQARLEALGCELVDRKPKFTFKKSNYYSMKITLAYLNGNEEVSKEKVQLSKKQQRMVDLGVKKPEDFATNGTSYGPRITVLKYVDFDLRNDFEDGPKDTEMKASEFEDEIYYPAAPEKPDEDDFADVNPPEFNKEEEADLFE